MPRVKLNRTISSPASLAARLPLSPYALADKLGEIKGGVSQPHPAKATLSLFTSKPTLLSAAIATALLA